MSSTSRAYSERRLTDSSTLRRGAGGELEVGTTAMRRLGGIHWGLLVAALLLSLAGMATVHSASAELATDYLPRQALWVVVGLALAAVSMAVDYQVLSKMAAVLYVLGVGALVAILLGGEVGGGARSWIGIGSFGGQPSEFMKPVVALLLARFLATRQRRILRLPEVVVAGVIAGIPMLLVALQPDLGSAAMFVPILGGMLIVAGIGRRTVAAAVAIALILGAGVWTFGMQEYQRERIISFVSPGSDPLGAGYQVRQSKIAVGSGALLGRGYMQGTQSQLRFLPARHTDFVFAVLAEDWGFLGVALILALYAIFYFSAAKVAMRARDRTGILLVVGLMSVFSFHVLYNAAMVVGLVPITGIPMPFLSYGGSFTLANFIGTGLILGVDLRRHVNR